MCIKWKWVYIIDYDSAIICSDLYIRREMVISIALAMKAIVLLIHTHTHNRVAHTAAIFVGHLLIFFRSRKCNGRTIVCIMNFNFYFWRKLFSGSDRLPSSSVRNFYVSIFFSVETEAAQNWYQTTGKIFNFFFEKKKCLIKKIEEIEAKCIQIPSWFITQENIMQLQCKRAQKYKVAHFGWIYRWILV